MRENFISKFFHLLWLLNHWIRKTISLTYQTKESKMNRTEKTEREEKKKNNKNYVMYDLKGSWEWDKMDGFSSKIKLRPKQNTTIIYGNEGVQKCPTLLKVKRKQRNVHNSGILIRSHFNSFCLYAVLTQFPIFFFSLFCFVRFMLGGLFFTPSADKKRWISKERPVHKFRTLNTLSAYAYAVVVRSLSIMRQKIFCRRNGRPR